jgi:multidrug resistance efflux pump
MELRARKMAAQAAKNRAQRELIRAQADLGKAEANLGLARSNYQRDLEVFKPGYISQASFDTTKAQLQAENEVTLQGYRHRLVGGSAQAESETMPLRPAELYYVLAP